MAQQTHSAWNAAVDPDVGKLFNVYNVVGANHIMYRFFVYKYNDTGQYWKEADHVQSIKSGDPDRPSRSKTVKGKVFKRGQYQPIGDRRYFTYYQMKKMDNKAQWESFLAKVIERKQKQWIAKVKAEILKRFGDKKNG